MSLSHIYAAKLKCQEYEKFIESQGDYVIKWIDEEYTNRRGKSINQRKWRLKTRAEALGYVQKKIAIQLKDNYSASTEAPSDLDDDIFEVDERLIIINPPVQKKLIDLFDTIISTTPQMKTYAEMATQTENWDEETDIDMVMSFKDLKNLAKVCGKRIKLTVDDLKN